MSTTNFRVARPARRRASPGRRRAKRAFLVPHSRAVGTRTLWPSREHRASSDRSRSSPTLRSPCGNVLRKRCLLVYRNTAAYGAETTAHAPRRPAIMDTRGGVKRRRKRLRQGPNRRRRRERRSEPRRTPPLCICHRRLSAYCPYTISPICDVSYPATAAASARNARVRTSLTIAWATRSISGPPISTMSSHSS